MKPCDVCGNEYDKSFEVRSNGSTFTFDSLECAVHRLAPLCAHCGCRVLGHGIESDDSIYCCGHCARESGVSEVVDRVDH